MKITEMAWGLFKTFKQIFHPRLQINQIAYEDMRGAGEWEAEEYV